MSTSKPSAAVLYRLVHAEHKSYAEIARLYEVDTTTIPLWLDKYGLDRADWKLSRYSGQPPTITIEEVVERYQAGESAVAIAQSAGFKSKTTILQMLHRRGLERRPSGWRPDRRLLASDGTGVRSTYELRVANWLIAHGVEYQYEPPIPRGRRLRSDFLVNGWYIEIWGVHSKPSYAESKARKQQLYARQNLPLIELSPHHFARDQHIFESRLRQTLQAPQSISH